MARTDTLGNYLTDVASAIKTKKGDSTPILASNFDTEIINLPSGGGTLQSKSIEITTNGDTTVSPDTGYDGLSSVAITTNVSGGSTEPVEKNVNLYDYDGTRLYSYTTSEFLQLTDYPTTTSHTGLTADGWTWLFQDAKTFVQKYGDLDIGRRYYPTDGKTKVYITIPSNDFLDIMFCFGYMAGAGQTITLDWGDNTTDTITTTATTTDYRNVGTRHTYSTPGSYVISISLPSNVRGIFEQKSNISNIMKPGTGVSASSQTAVSVPYLGMIKKIEFGSFFNIKVGAFSQCVGLETITTHSGFSVVGSASNLAYTYVNCKQLKCIMLPKGGSSYYTLSGALQNNTNLKCLLYPKGDIRYIASPRLFNSDIFKSDRFIMYGFSNSPFITDISNRRLILPYEYNASSSVTLGNTTLMNFANVEEILVANATALTISSGGLNSFNNLKKLDLSRLTVIPTMGGTSLGQYFPKTCKIIVPDDLYDDWIVASGWSNYVNQIVRASQA